MKRRELWAVTVVAVALLAGGGAFAQPEDPGASPEVAPPPDPGEELGTAIEEAYEKHQEKVTVTAGARSQKLADVPMTLSYLGATELEGTGQFSICDTVALFPGMECRRGAMRQATVSTRGLGFNFLSNRLLLLKDGRPETDPWTGSFLADDSNPLTNVKRIEVIRGPGSSLYGSSAFAGVINYVSRGADDLIKEGNRAGVDARALAGQNNTYRAQATAAGKAGDLKGLVNYYAFHTDGSPQFTDPARGIEDTQQWSDVQQGQAKLEYKIAKVDATYTWSHDGHPGGNPASIVGNCGRCHYTAHDSESIRALDAQAALDIPVTSWLSFAARSFINVKRREVTVENLVSERQVAAVNVRQRIGGDVKGNLTVGKLNVIAGADVKADAVNTASMLPGLTPADTQSKSFGAYADAEYKIGRKLILGAGLRFDAFDMPASLWKNNTSELSPRASVVFHAAPTLTIRGNYGHAFRAPVMVELAILQPMYAATLQGNPYLKPERLDTGEVAIDFWPFGEVLRFTDTIFYTRATNFINEEPISATTSQFQNVGGGTLAGTEVEAAIYAAKLRTSFNLAYQYLYTWRDTTALPFDYAPTHRLQFRAHTQISQAVFADVFGSYVGERNDPGFQLDPSGHRLAAHVVMPAYLLVNARVGWNVTDQISASVVAINMFNTSYEETIGFPAGGVRLFAELKFTY